MKRKNHGLHFKGRKGTFNASFCDGQEESGDGFVFQRRSDRLKEQDSFKKMPTYFLGKNNIGKSLRIQEN